MIQQRENLFAMMEEDKGLVERIMSDEVTFHFLEKSIDTNVQIWGCQFKDKHVMC